MPAAAGELEPGSPIRQNSAMTVFKWQQEPASRSSELASITHSAHRPFSHRKSSVSVAVKLRCTDSAQDLQYQSTFTLAHGVIALSPQPHTVTRFRQVKYAIAGRFLGWTDHRD